MILSFSQFLCLFLLIICILSGLNQSFVDQKKSNSKVISKENWLLDAADANTFLKIRYSKENDFNKRKYYSESKEYNEQIDTSEEL